MRLDNSPSPGFLAGKPQGGRSPKESDGFGVYAPIKNLKKRLDLIFHCFSNKAPIDELRKYLYNTYYDQSRKPEEEGGTIFFNNNLSGATKRVYDYLFDEIVSSHLLPGSVISELEIAKKLQTSRSPVREAMMVLESEGLVRRYPGRGCFVSEITVQDINEIFSLRVLLEVEALHRSFDFMVPRELEDLERDLTALTPEDPENAYYETDRRLHELIVSNCGNVRLTLILRTLNGQIEQIRRVASREPQRLRASRMEHLAIVDALQDRDLERACRLLREHIQNVQAATMSVCLMMGVRETKGIR